MSAAPEETVFDATRARLLPYLAEAWRFRNLMVFLAWKNLKVQFAQTSLGIGWLFLRPLLHVTMLTIIFGKLARIPTDGIPYPLFALSGLLAWFYFANVVSRASSSLLGAAGMINKVYFPRLLLPLTPILGSLAEFGATYVVFVGVSAAMYGHWPSATLLFLPVPMLVLIVTAAGAGLWLAALSVNYRDIRQATGNLLQLMMFATPVVWPLSLLPQRLGALGSEIISWFAYYPLLGVVEGFRYSLLGRGEPPWALIGPGAITAVLLLASGLLYFRKHEREFADVV